MKSIDQFVEELNNKFPKTSPFQNTFVYVTGGKYYKICHSRDGITPESSYAFVDKKTGDLYKSASYKQPAKGIRGNINDDSGLAACDQYSVVYRK